MIVGVIKQLKLKFVVTVNLVSFDRECFTVIESTKNTECFILTLEHISKAWSKVNVVCMCYRPGTVLTVQSLSEDDYKLWMQAMGGKEPVSQPQMCHHHLPHRLSLISFHSCLVEQLSFVSFP